MNTSTSLGTPYSHWNIQTLNCKEPVFKKQFNQSEMPNQKRVHGGSIALLNRLGLKYEDDRYVFGELNGVTGYAGDNPLLKNGMTGQLLMIDRPHLSGELPTGNNGLKDVIYDPQYNNYGKKYTNYYDITGGQIQYYMDYDTADPYFKPVYTNPAEIVSYLKDNPMGVYEFYYDRYPKTPYDWDKCKKSECDSFTHDSLQHREDLMALQQRKVNQQRYSNRWGATH